MILPDEEYKVPRLQELELLDDKCLKALNHIHVYQNRLQLSYNKKVKTQEFDIGDLVLMQNQKNLQDHEKKGNFNPNCLGPCIITTKYGSGAYQLATPKGDPLDEPMNIMHLKRFVAS